MPRETFQPGERVRSRDGETGTIVEVHPRRPLVRVRWESGAIYWHSTDFLRRHRPASRQAA